MDRDPVPRSEGKEREPNRLFAFVGPAGTGKSQRAQMVASFLEAEYIVDDGLVICRGQIVCGKSAKSERNQVRAIRRALFEFEDHRRTVAEFFQRVQPCSILLISTSEGMARRIARRLGLPEPCRFLHIEEVATAEEICRAQRERKHKGQHVIPVSHVQVRRNFTGKLVGRLRVLWRPKDLYEGEKTIVRPPFNFYGEVHIEPEAIAQLVAHVALMTGQVGKVAQVRVRPEEDQLSVSMDLALEPGSRNFTEVARQVRQRVASSVRYFSGLEVRQVDIQISEVLV